MSAQGTALPSAHNDPTADHQLPQAVHRGVDRRDLHPAAPCVGGRRKGRWMVRRARGTWAQSDDGRPGQAEHHQDHGRQFEPADDHPPQDGPGQVRRGGRHGSGQPAAGGERQAA